MGVFGASGIGLNDSAEPQGVTLGSGPKRGFDASKARS